MSSLVHHASGTCPNSASFPAKGSCCYKWNQALGVWEFVAGSCAGDCNCPGPLSPVSYTHLTLPTKVTV